MIFDLIKWGADSANGFYRALHSHGVWIPRDDIRWISSLGWGVTDPGLHTSRTLCLGVASNVPKIRYQIPHGLSKLQVRKPMVLWPESANNVALNYTG